MKKSSLALSALFISTIVSFAQIDGREPGLYYVNLEESVPLTYQSGINKSSGTEMLGFEISNKTIRFKGETSDTPVAQASFVLVCDLKKKSIVKTLKKYDVFVKNITPDNMILVKLDVGDGKRFYDTGVAINGININKKERPPFEWEQITDNSWQVTANLEPGEYGFIFKASRLSDYDFDSIFDFTVVEE